MTKQEYYNLLVKSATDGTFPSIDKDSKMCMYRGQGGSKCAVGVIMPDDVYQEEFENQPFTKYLVAITGSDWIPDNLTVEDLNQVQHAHDFIARRSWDPTEFIQDINRLPCFQDCVRKEISPCPMS